MVESVSVRRIEIAGAPYERGVRYGGLVADEISECVKVYARWFTQFCALEWSQVREKARDYLSWLEGANSELAAEMKGVAEGCGRDLLDIVVLNFRTEIAYGASGILGACECTSVGVPSVASDDGHVYVAENWDWLADTLPLTVLLEISNGDQRLATFTEAGMVGKFGVNSAGVGLCVNLLACNENRVGAGFHVLARKVLESTSMLGAVWSVTGAQRAGSGNFMIGNAGSGEVVDLEWLPSKFNILSPRGSSMVHTNHFVGDTGGATDRVQIMSDISPGTFLRRARAERLLEEMGEPIGVKELKMLLADHASAPEGICRHGGRVGEHIVLGQTNLSVIIDVSASRIYFGRGPACEADYITYEAPWAASAPVNGP